MFKSIADRINSSPVAAKLAAKIGCSSCLNKAANYGSQNSEITFSPTLYAGAYRQGGSYSFANADPQDAGNVAGFGRVLRGFLGRIA